MNYELITIIVGFVAITIAILQQGYNTRVELKGELYKLENSLSKRLDKLEDNIKQTETNLRNEFKQDLNTLEVKLNTLLLGLFRNYNPPPENKNQENKQ